MPLHTTLKLKDLSLLELDNDNCLIFGSLAEWFVIF
jgi:hypothetical protein